MAKAYYQEWREKALAYQDIIERLIGMGIVPPFLANDFEKAKGIQEHKRRGPKPLKTKTQEG